MSRFALRRLGALLLTPTRVLTPTGGGVLFIGIASLVIGTWLNWQEFTQIGGVAVVLVALALLWVTVPASVRADIVVQPTRVTVGRSAVAILRVQAGALPLMNPVFGLAWGRTDVLVRFGSLGPFGRRQEQIDLPRRPRGEHPVGPVWHERQDVFGLARRRCPLEAEARLLVRPRVVAVELFAGGLTNDLEGATSQQLSMSDLAFHALREYEPGDDLRHVHWRSSAKAGQLLTRQYRETRRGQLTVLLDNEQPSYPRRADFELAVSIATSVALRGVRDDFDVYLRCGGVLAHGRQPDALLDVACRFEFEDGPYGAACAAAAMALPTTGLVVQVSGPGRPDPGLRAAAAGFGPDVSRLVLRADSRGHVGLASFQGNREVTLTRLGQLPGLLARVRR